LGERGYLFVARGGRIAALLPEQVARHETFAETGGKPKFPTAPFG